MDSGIYCRGSSRYDSRPIIANCTVSGNSTERGGGIHCARYSRPIIKNCTVSDNSANEGGGIYAERDSDITVTNSILWFNTAALGNEIYLDAYYSPYSGTESTSTAAVSYSDVEGGAEAVYVEPNSILNWELGNIDADPCFVMPGYWDVNSTPEDFDDDFWVEGDYHLLAGSPCIDSGDPNYVPKPNETDLDGNPRIVNDRIDMGAYEYTPPVQAQINLTPQMLNCDSRGNWLKAHVILPEGYYPEDIDVNTPAVAEPPGIESEFIEVNEYSDGSFDVQIYFDREVFCEALSESEDGLLEVTVTGSLTDGRKFQGSDTIKLQTPPWHHQHRQNKKLFKGRRK
jgi:predicted outer membrane repeat protein